MGRWESWKHGRRVDGGNGTSLNADGDPMVELPGSVLSMITCVSLSLDSGGSHSLLSTKS